MKCYIVYCIPDYIGIEIKGIFLNEKKAEEYCKKLKQENITLHNNIYDHDISGLDVIEYEIIE